MSQESIYISDYTEKAIAVFGDSKPIKDHLSALGGKFNPSLRGDGDEKKAGWIFPKTKRSDVQALLDKAKKGELSSIEEKQSPIERISRKKIDSNDFTISKEMYLSLITRIEKLETELALTKKILFNDSKTKHPVQSPATVPKFANLKFESENEESESESEEEQKVPQRRLLNLSKK